jgi:hypothetical protein
VEICSHYRHFRDTYASIISHVIKGSNIQRGFFLSLELTDRDSTVAS